MAMLVEPSQPLKREQIDNIMSIVDAKKCPFYTEVRKKGPVDNTYAEFPADAYDTPTAASIPDGHEVEAADYENPAENRGLIGCRAHNWRRVMAIGNLASGLSDVAGVGKGKEIMVGKMKKLRELKRDIEYTCLNTQDSAADDGTDGTTTRGLGEWIKSTAQAADPVPAAFRTPAASIFSGTTDSVRETTIQDILQSAWEQTGGGVDWRGYCGSLIKRQFTEWLNDMTPGASELPLRRFTQDAKSNSIEMSIDIFKGDFGRVVLIPDPFMPNQRTAYFLDMNVVELRPHQLPADRELAYTGGAQKREFTACLMLVVRNPLGLAKLATTAS